MSTYTSFAVIGAGNMGKFIIDELLKLKTDGAISSVTLVTRSVRCPLHAPLLNLHLPPYLSEHP